MEVRVFNIVYKSLGGKCWQTHGKKVFKSGVVFIVKMVDEVQRGVIVFQGKQFRRLWYKEEWYYSIIDIIAFLNEQDDFQTARKYWNKLSQRLREEGSEVVTNCHRLKPISSI